MLRGLSGRKEVIQRRIKLYLDTRRMFEICSKLKIKTPERRHTFISKLEQISRVVLVFPLLILNK